jgi:hypothetical protein
MEAYMRFVLLLAPLLLFAACDSSSPITVDSGHPDLARKDIVVSDKKLVEASPAHDLAREGIRLDHGKPSWTLTGEVVVKTACAAGTSPFAVIVGLTTTCGDWTTLLELQKLSTSSAKPTYVFNVADGVYQLMAFMDCNGNASATLPVPDVGDVTFHVVSGTEDKPCRQYDLKGQGLLEAAIELNTVVK